jgi:hypothetical protein
VNSHHAERARSPGWCIISQHFTKIVVTGRTLSSRKGVASILSGRVLLAAAKDSTPRLPSFSNPGR